MDKAAWSGPEPLTSWSPRLRPRPGPLPAVVGRPGSPRPPGGNGSPVDPAAPLPAGGVQLAAVERSFVEKALRDARGNKSKAARLLGLTRSQFYSRMQKYGVD